MSDGDLVIPVETVHPDGNRRLDATGTLTFVSPSGEELSAIDAAKALLKLGGYVVLKEKSYRQAQERQRVAEAYARSDREDAESARHWARTTLHNEIRDLQARCTFLYGAARARGATVDELKGGWTVVGANLPLEKASTIQCHCGIHPYIIHDKDARPDYRFVCPDHGLVTLNGADQ